MFWRRRAWDKVGPIDRQFHYALDWDFMLRAEAAGFKLARLRRFLACFRVHDEQKTTKSYERGPRGDAEAAPQITWARPEPDRDLSRHDAVPDAAIRHFTGVIG